MTPAITWADLPALLPLIVLTGTALVVMLQASIRRHHGTAVVITLAGLLLALASLPMELGAEARSITPLLRIDAFVLYGWTLLLLVALVVSVMAWGYWRRQRLPMEELYILLLCATLGGCVLIASQHFAALFIGLELMTVSLIAMLGYPVGDRDLATAKPLEAALKYLVLSAVSSAVLLFGIALLYAETGHLDYSGMARFLMSMPMNLYLLLGLGLVVVGLGFKLSLVPFHLWTPDVYQGAPTPVTAFIATLSKGAVLALLLRYIQMADVQQQPLVLGALVILAVASMLIGNLLALLQDNPKRLLAYSSIAHMGYALLAPLVAGPFGMEAMAVYLAAYLLMTLGAFAALACVGEVRGEPQHLDELRGLLWQRPAIALSLSLMLLSLAGIPLTAGFIGKFYLVTAAVEGQLWMPLLALVIGSVIGLFYYLRVVVMMVQMPATAQSASTQAGPGFVAGVLLLTISVAVIVVGVYPTVILAILRNVAQVAG